MENSSPLRSGQPDKRTRHKQHSESKRIVLVAAALLFGITGGLHGASPDPLLKLVGQDVGLCFEVQDLHQRLHDFESSDVLARLSQVPAYQQWRDSNRFRQLKAAAAYIETLAQSPFQQIVEDLFGESVVLALYPTAEREPAVVLMTRTAGVEELETALAAWNQIDQHETTTLRHAGQTYYRAAKPNQSGKPSQSQYYWKRDRIFCLSNREDAIRRVVDRDNTAPDQDDTSSLFNSSLYRSSRDALPPDSVVAVYLNPRPWDQKMSPSPTNRTFLDFWQKCRSIVFGVQWKHGLVMRAAVQFAAGRDSSDDSVRVAPNAQNDLLKRVPPQAVVVMRGVSRPRVETIERLIQLLPEKGQREWQKVRRVIRGLLMNVDLFDEVLPRLEGNWVAFLEPRTPTGNTPDFLDGLVAVPLPAVPERSMDEGRQQADVREAIDNALTTSLNVFAVTRNESNTGPLAFVRSQHDQNVRVRWVENLGPYRPSFAFTQNHLVLATQPRLVAQFATANSEAILPAHEKVQSLTSEFFPDADQMMCIDLPKACDALDAIREPLINQFSGGSQEKRKTVSQRLKTTTDLLRVFDAALLGLELRSDSFRLTLGIVGNALPPAHSE